MKLRAALVLILVCVAAIVFSCRRNQPSLVDANRAPDTELWYAPPDSTEYEYLVHLYWRGVDQDGIAVRYIWTITDTIVPGQLGWDPSQRIRDFRSGHLTTGTDSVFSFTAFRDVGGVGLKKNRQAFHIAAIDDNGVIDPSPARIEFVATVETLPKMKFVTSVTRVDGGVRTVTTRAHDPAAIDTVGMFRPFAIFYQGSTVNGSVRESRFFPLTADVIIPGADVWTGVPTDFLAADVLDTNVTAIPVGDGSLFLPDQIVLVQSVDPQTGAASSENMRVVDVLGNTLEVDRGFGNTQEQDSLFAGARVTIAGRFFRNVDDPSFSDAQALPSGRFRFAAQVRDDAGAE